MKKYQLNEMMQALAQHWDKLSNSQKSSIARILTNVQNKDTPVHKDQITLDELLCELEENYRQKIRKTEVNHDKRQWN